MWAAASTPGVWTLVLLMQVAAKAGVAVIVADRPNLLGGAVEGPGVSQPSARWWACTMCRSATA